jgi:hypothetical protein
MEKKFIVPAVTMLAGILVWLAFLVSHEAGDERNEKSLLLGAGQCLVAGGLIVFSAVRCRRVGGPLIGNIVRTGLLIVMSAITYWRVDVVTACVLAVAAILTGVMVLMKIYWSEATEDSVSASKHASSENE